jgi:hypothetical protein
MVGHKHYRKAYLFRLIRASISSCKEAENLKATFRMDSGRPARCPHSIPNDSAIEDN